MNKDPKNRRTYEESCLIVPHGAWYQNLFLEISIPCNHWGMLFNSNTREPHPMAVVGDFYLEDTFSQAVLGTASCLTRMTTQNSKEQGSTSQPTGRRNPHLPPPLKINTSLPASRKTCRVPPAKRGNHTRPAAGSWGLLCPKSLTPQAARNHLAGLNAPPQAKEWPDKHDTEDHSASSNLKDRFYSHKGSRHSSDKESSSTAQKRGLSPALHASLVECPWKGPHMEEPSHAPGESSCASHRSPS